MNLNEIVIGVFIAAFLVFLRNAHIVAQRQKIVSTQLDAYLRYWHKIVLDKELPEVEIKYRTRIESHSLSELLQDI